MRFFSKLIIHEIPVSIKDLNKDSGHEIPDLSDAAILAGISSAANIASKFNRILIFFCRFD